MENHSTDHSTISEQHKRSERFDRKIAVLNLSGEQKSEVAKQIIEDIHVSGEYRSQMFLSIVIATLGLLINATPVVIGAMIIAPILRPIQAIAFATSTGNRTLFGKSLWILFMSIVGGICVAYLLTLFLPLTEITNEIAIRTQPTLVDLGIAFASGLVAFLAFGRKKMSAGLAGVAMAASLVPPLAVIGIGIGFNTTYIARGSTVLFLTNLVAIIIAGIIIFYLFGFYPTQKDDVKRSIINSTSALIMLIILCIPLASSLVTITKRENIQRTIINTTNTFIGSIDKRISIESMDVKKINDTQEISLTLKVPQELTKQLTEQEQAILTEKLSLALASEVAVDMRLLPVTRVTKIVQQETNMQDRLLQTTNSYVTSLYHDQATLLDVSYHTANKRIVIATMFADNDFPTQEFDKNYETYIKETYPEIEKIVVNRQHETQDASITLTKNQKIQKEIQENFMSYFSNTILHNINVISTETHMNIDIYASTPLSQEAYALQMTERENLLVELYNKKVTTDNYLNYLTRIE